jgi:hypothetical protein
MALRLFNQCLDSRARADKRVTLRGRHHAFPAKLNGRDQCQREGRAVMEFRICARGAPGSIPIPRGSTCTPNSRHKCSGSTVTGLSFHLSYKSLNTVVPVALSPNRRMRGKSDSVSIVAPAATIARRASCRPLLFAVVCRISTSATRQNIAPPSMFGSTYAFHPAHGRLSEAVPRPCRQPYLATRLLQAIGHPGTGRWAPRGSPALLPANDVCPEARRSRGGRVRVSWSNLIQDQLEKRLDLGASSKRFEIHPHPPKSFHESTDCSHCSAERLLAHTGLEIFHSRCSPPRLLYVPTQGRPPAEGLRSPTAGLPRS